MSTPTCAHCQTPVAENYVFCASCWEKLPKPLRDEIKRNYREDYRDNWLQKRWHTLACREALGYLSASDTSEYIWQCARQNITWAVEVLMKSGELDHHGYLKMLGYVPPSELQERQQ